MKIALWVPCSRDHSGAITSTGKETSRITIEFGGQPNMQNLKDRLGPVTLHPQVNSISSLPHAIGLMGIIQILFLGSGAEDSVGLPEILHVTSVYLLNSAFIPFGFTAGAWYVEVAGGELRVNFAIFPELFRASHEKPHYGSQMGSKSMV